MKGRGHKLCKEAGEHEEVTGAPVDESTESRRQLHCVGCGHAVTAPEERRDVDGHHRHSCVNPAGVVFHIGCFSRAPGMSQHGPRVLEHSWFAGYGWTVGLCGGCDAHLGWAFRGEDKVPFWGLILARLEERDTS